MKKKLTILLICCLSCTSLFSCGGKDSKKNKDQQEVSAQNENEMTTVVTGFTFDIPEVFIADESRQNFWLSNDDSGSNIQYSTHVTSEADFSISSEELKSEMESQFLELGYEIEVTIESNTSFTIDGYEAYRIVSSFGHGTTNYKQIQIIVITPNLIGDIIYTDINESGCMDAFEQSIASIHVASEAVEITE